jgi:hypothetical protein
VRDRRHLVGATVRAAAGAALTTSPTIRRCDDAEQLLALAGDFLAAREAEHNLLFGILGSLLRDPHTYGDAPPYLAAALGRTDVTGVCLRTPPFGPVLSELDDSELAAAFADDLATVTGTLAGVVGRPGDARSFAARWRARMGVEARVVMTQRIYATETAVAPAGVPGAARRYRDDDRDLVLTWLAAFSDDALGERSVPLEAERWLDRRLADPDTEILLWEVSGEPVSLAAAGTPTPNGLRVGPVYTPPERRRRGYAEAVTAEVTRRALAGRRRFCFLFTDLANPTSNAIYQRIGYAPVGDVDQWAFE